MKKNTTNKFTPAIAPHVPETKPAVAPEAKAESVQVCIIQMDRYNSAMEWAYNNLTAAQYGQLTGRMGQPSVGDFAPSKQ